MTFFKASMSSLLGILVSGALTGSAWAETMGCNSMCGRHEHGAPGPIVGAGLPVILVVGGILFVVMRLRQKRLARG
jgi:hypothetical protein